MSSSPTNSTSTTSLPIISTTSANAIFFDSTRCTGCRACQVACKNWNDLPGYGGSDFGTEAPTQFNPDGLTNPRDLSPNTWLIQGLHEVVQSDGTFKEVFMRHSCMHCADAPCVNVCPARAISKLETGPVIVNKALCIGVGYCVNACPWHAINLEEAPGGTAHKCTLCYDRISNGLAPACVKSCPADALFFGPRDQMLSQAQSRAAAVGGTVYGEEEVGGTDVFYVLPAGVTLEDAQLPTTPQTTPVKQAGSSNLEGVIEVGLVGAVVAGAGIYLLKSYSERRSKIAAEAQASGQKEEVKQ
ncbi:MAG: 4Fe-4S dicluster domain-containing protein [Nitrososphaerota archaeon]|nr:4Fe-4S dicluster domain-containing protein [Nitrososphaerota archaeon]